MARSKRMQTAIAKLKHLARSMTELKRITDNQIEQDAEDHVNDQGEMEKIIEARFQHSSERATGAGTWAPWSPKYHGVRLLDKTGTMKDAAISSVAGTYRVDHVDIEWDASHIGVLYAEYHQNGTGNIPARRFMLNPNNDELKEADEVAVTAIEEFGLDKLKGAMRI